MIRVPFHFCWTSFVTLDKHTGREAIDAHDRCVMLRDTGCELRLIDVRKNLFCGEFRAPVEPGERETRAQQLHEVSSRKLAGLESSQIILMKRAMVVSHSSTSSVTSSARRYRTDVILRDQSAAETVLINLARRRPCHRGYLIRGPYVFFGRGVTTDAPSHRERRCLIN